LQGRPTSHGKQQHKKDDVKTTKKNTLKGRFSMTRLILRAQQKNSGDQQIVLETKALTTIKKLT